MKLNQDYKNAALASLKGNWASAIVAVIACLAINCVSSVLVKFADIEGAVISLLINVFVVLPVSFGLQNAFKKLYNEGDADLCRNAFCFAFNDRYLHVFGGMLLMQVYILLWSLLLLVPGFIKAYSYAMTPYILADNPELSADGAITLSMNMMKGHKFDLFYLHLSFIGWALLCILTLGIGFFWLVPYIQTSQAAFYADLKSECVIN